MMGRLLHTRGTMFCIETERRDLSIKPHKSRGIKRG